MAEADEMQRAVLADDLLANLRQCGLPGLGVRVKLPIIMGELPLQIDVGSDEDYAVLTIEESDDALIATLERGGESKTIAEGRLRQEIPEPAGSPGGKGAPRPPKGRSRGELGPMISFKVEPRVAARLERAGGNRSELLRRALDAELDRMGVAHE